MARDLIWDVLALAARRRRSLARWSATDGFDLTDKWTDVFEPVRQRRLLGGTWREVQPVQQAASNIGQFLRERPDRRPADP